MELQNIGSFFQHRAGAASVIDAVVIPFDYVTNSLWDCILTNERPDPNIWNCSFTSSFTNRFHLPQGSFFKSDLIKIVNQENDLFCGYIFNNGNDYIPESPYIGVIASPKNYLSSKNNYRPNRNLTNCGKRNSIFIMDLHFTKII